MFTAANRRFVIFGALLLVAGAWAGCASPEEATDPNLEDGTGISAGEDDFGPGASPAPGQNESPDGQEGMLPPP